jgi:signal recognition particle subunit SRP54
MFNNLSNKLTSVLDKLRGRGVLTEVNIDEALREVRIALLEADVALPVVKTFIQSLKEKAIGAQVVQSISPAQMVVKLVNDHLTELLGSEYAELNFASVPPIIFLIVGLQGSGKTTSTGKLALRLKNRYNKKVLLASLDVYRPAAQQQLEVLAGQAGVGSLPIVAGEKPLAITKRALEVGKLEGYDVILLDTAGRLHIDDELMRELQDIKTISHPLETLLVADSLTGQDAVNIASQFNEKIGLTGIILTRMDGDGRGGAALSMRAVTGQPIKFAGVGEKLSDFEEFHPARIASRILDMGDVVSLVERAAETIDKAEAEKMAAKFQEGSFDFDDLLSQLRNMKKMGGLGGLMNMLPGVGKIKEQMANANIDENVLLHQEAIILSMTPKERKNPKLLNGSRKLRIAKGSGTSVQEINKLFKAWQQMETMIKQMKKLGKKGMMRTGLKNLLPMV